MSTVALNSTKGRWVMVATIMASSMAFIDGTALNVALPALQSSFHATSSELFWILNAYLLMLASLILIGGSLGDKIGRKLVFMFGISIFIIVLIELRTKHPMMPMSIFTNRTFSGVNLLTLFLYAGLGGGMLFLPLNLVQAQGYSQFESGLTILPFAFLMITLARYTGRLSDKYGARMFLIAGPMIAGAGQLMLAL